MLQLKEVVFYVRGGINNQDIFQLKVVLYVHDDINQPRQHAPIKEGCPLWT